MSPAAAPFRLAVRVYWEDTDAGGVVFYANYLKFFERARTEWLRERGFGQEALRRDHDTLFVVTDTALRFVRPARLDDLLSVTVEVRKAGGASLQLAQQAFRLIDGGASELLAEGTIRIGCVAAGTFTPRRIPKDLLTTTSR